MVKLNSPSLGFVFLGSILLFSCSTDTSEEVEFEGVKFGIEIYSTQGFKGFHDEGLVTYQIGRLYFERQGKKIYYAGPEHDNMDVFPSDTTLLNQIPHTIIDVMGQDGRNPRCERSTLYLDPDIFSAEDYNIFARFIQFNYSLPFETNKVSHWLTKSLDMSELDLPPPMVNVIVHQKLDNLQPVFWGTGGKERATLQLDNSVTMDYISKFHTEDLIFFHLRNDSLYYPDYASEGEQLAKNALGFKSKSGETLGERVIGIRPYSRKNEFIFSACDK